MDPAIIVEVCKRNIENQEHCVVGPCIDGGFYLFGSKYPLSEDIWTKVQYSCDDTLSQLLIQISKAGFSHSSLPRIGDVDTISDIFALKKQLIEKEMSLLPKQRLLLSWLKLAITT